MSFYITYKKQHKIISIGTSGWPMVEIIEIRREHQSKVWGFQKELEAVNRCVRNLRVVRVPRNYPHTCVYDTYWYIFKKLGKHQSKNLMMVRFFLIKKITDLKSKAWVSPQKNYGAYLGLLHMVSTWFLRVCRQCSSRSTIFTMFFVKFKKVFI